VRSEGIGAANPEPEKISTEEAERNKYLLADLCGFSTGRGFFPGQRRERIALGTGRCLQINSAILLA